MQEDLDIYKENLIKIKYRIKLIDDFTLLNNNIPADIFVENTYLQFRKILELIILSSLLANKVEYIKQYNKIKEVWDIKNRIKYLEKINRSFYPKPSIQKITFKKPDKRNIEIVDLKKDFLTLDNLYTLLDTCNSLLHVENPFLKPLDYGKLLNDIPAWREKIIKLLNHHTINLNNGHIIVGMMEASTDGKPYAFNFVQI